MPLGAAARAHIEHFHTGAGRREFEKRQRVAALVRLPVGVAAVWCSEQRGVTGRVLHLLRLCVSNSEHGEAWHRAASQRQEAKKVNSQELFAEIFCGHSILPGMIHARAVNTVSREVLCNGSGPVVEKLRTMC